MITGRIIGLRLVLSYKNLDSASLTCALMAAQSVICFSSHLRMIFRTIARASSIRTLDSRTYTKPREIRSGPETSWPVSASNVATMTISPSLARCRLSRRTILPTSPTPSPSTKTRPACTVPVI